MTKFNPYYIATIIVIACGSIPKGKNIPLTRLEHPS